MKVVGWTVVFLLVIGMGVSLGYVIAQEPTPTQVVLQESLAVPAVCSDALDHADELVLLTGEAVGAAARGQEDLVDLVQRATRAAQDYQDSAKRCRSFE